MSRDREHLIPGRREFDGADIIFTMNSAAQKRAAAGVPVINATVGALLDDQGTLVVLESVMHQYRQLTPMEIAPYAPIAGDPAYLLALTQRHWPSLASYGMGVATPGGTGSPDRQACQSDRSRNVPWVMSHNEQWARPRRAPIQ